MRGPWKPLSKPGGLQGERCGGGGGAAHGGWGDLCLPPPATHLPTSLLSPSPPGLPAADRKAVQGLALSEAEQSAGPAQPLGWSFPAAPGTNPNTWQCSDAARRRTSRQGRGVPRGPCPALPGATSKLRAVTLGAGTGTWRRGTPHCPPAPHPRAARAMNEPRGAERVVGRWAGCQGRGARGCQAWGGGRDGAGAWVCAEPLWDPPGRCHSPPPLTSSAPRWRIE